MFTDRRAIVAALLLLVVLAGGALRARAATWPRAETSGDEKAYTRLAIGLAEHGAYDDETLHWPPGAPLLFAAAYKLTGEKTGDRLHPDIPAAHWAQALVGTLTILIVFGIATLLAGPVAGLPAAAAIAFYPPLIYYTRDLLSEPFGAFMVALAVLALTWAWRIRRAWPLALSGFVLGGAVLVRADLLFAPFAVAILAAIVVWRTDGWRRGITAGATLAVGACLAILPWTIVASRMAGEFVPVTRGAGDALFVGSFLPGNGTRTGMQRSFLVEEARRHNPALRHRPGLIRQAELLDAVAARRPDLERSDALVAEALANVRRYTIEDPIGYGSMMADKARRMWLRYSYLGGRRELDSLRRLHSTLVVLSFAGLLAGLWRARNPVLAAIALILAYSTTLHTVIALSWPRYALPLLPILVAGGAAGTVVAVQSWRSSTAPILPGAPSGSRP